MILIQALDLVLYRVFEIVFTDYWLRLFIAQCNTYDMARQYIPAMVALRLSPHSNTHACLIPQVDTLSASSAHLIPSQDVPARIDNGL